jgi:hypothetical protein
LVDSSLLAAAAGQLRLIQHDCAQDLPAARQQRLAEVLRTYVERVLPQDRRTFLEELQERFPTPDVMPAPDAPSAPATEPEPTEPLILAQRLVEALHSAPDTDRRDVGDFLAHAGLVPSAKGQLPDELVQPLRQALQMTPAESIHPAAMGDVVTALVDFASQLEPFAWRIWRALTPRAALPRTRLRDVMRAYVRGQKEASAAADLAQLRKLTMLLLNTIPNAPTEFFQSHLATFSVESISDAVEAQGHKIYQNKEALCWRKYQELASGLDRSAVEKAFASIIYRLVYEADPAMVTKEAAK